MKQQQTILHINPFLSITFKDPELIIISLYGKIKKIKCNHLTFKTILSAVNGKNTITQILDILKEEYSEEFLHHVLSDLTESKIIIENYTEISQVPNLIFPNDNDILIKKLKTAHIGLVGNGLIAHFLICNMDKIDCNKCLTIFDSNNIDNDIDQFLETIKSSNIDLLIACPNKANYRQLWRLYEICASIKRSCLICYFDGKDIILGPTFIPNKTPCYGCLIEHRLNLIHKNSNIELSIEDIAEVVLCWPLQHFPMLQIIGPWVGGLIISEMLNLIDGTAFPQFTKKQIYIPLYLTTSFKKIHFEATTACKICYGLNRGNLIYNSAKAVPPIGNKILLHDLPSQHNDGGYRAMKPETAKELVDHALKKIGISLKFERSGNGPLDDILPSYRVKISNCYKKELPILITEKNQWGKGITDEQAFLSGTFELFERICSDYYGNVEMIRATYQDVQDIAIDVETRIGKVYFDRGIDQFDKTMPIDWVWGYSLMQKRNLLVPASMAYLSKSKFHGYFHAITSGGLAAGTSLEDAILQGLMETIEHDAWMIWQANAITTPQVRNASIKDEVLLKLIKSIEQAGFRLIIRYQPTDIGLPVFRTWIVDKNNYITYAGNGLGANLSSEIALKRSITEAKLYLPSYKKQEPLYYGSSNNLDLINNKTSLFYLYHFNRIDISDEDHPQQSIDFEEIPNNSTGSILGDIEKTLELIKRSVPGSDVVVINLTKELIGIPVVKVISVGLQGLSEPIQCVQNRLFQLPVTLGYRDYKLTYPQLYNNRYPR